MYLTANDNLKIIFMSHTKQKYISKKILDPITRRFSNKKLFDCILTSNKSIFSYRDSNTIDCDALFADCLSTDCNGSWNG